MIRPNEVKKIAMYGSGTIGGGLAAYFALKGLEVNVCDIDVENARPKIQQAIDAYVKYGITDRPEEIWGRIYITADPEEAFRGICFVQENGPEKPEVKQQMIRVLEKYLPEDAVISSSSTGMPASVVSEGAMHPERIMVSHPFNPSYLIPLMEISKSDQTEQKYVDWTVEFFRIYDKTPIVVKKDKPGFVANRLAHALWREEVALVTEGVCTLEEADSAICFGPGLRWGIMGPALGYELGAGDMGLGEMLRRYAVSSNNIFADLSSFKETPAEFPGIAEIQMEELKKNLPDYMGHEISEIAEYRDTMLVELLKMHRKL